MQLRISWFVSLFLNMDRLKELQQERQEAVLVSA